MSERNDDEKRALALISAIIRHAGTAFQHALSGYVMAVTDMQDIRDDVDALETVLRRIQKANDKPRKPVSKKAEVVND